MALVSTESSVRRFRWTRAHYDRVVEAGGFGHANGHPSEALLVVEVSDIAPVRAVDAAIAVSDLLPKLK